MCHGHVASFAPLTRRRLLEAGPLGWKSLSTWTFRNKDVQKVLPQASFALNCIVSWQYNFLMTKF